MQASAGASQSPVAGSPVTNHFLYFANVRENQRGFLKEMFVCLLVPSNVANSMVTMGSSPGFLSLGIQVFFWRLGPSLQNAGSGPRPSVARRTCCGCRFHGRGASRERLCRMLLQFNWRWKSGVGGRRPGGAARFLRNTCWLDVQLLNKLWMLQTSDIQLQDVTVDFGCCYWKALGFCPVLKSLFSQLLCFLWESKVPVCLLPIVLMLSFKNSCICQQFVKVRGHLTLVPGIF